MNTFFFEPDREPCAICNQPVSADDVVLLEDVGDEHWIVLAVGLQPGTVVELSGTAFVCVHSSCLVEKGEQRGQMPPSG